MRSRGLLAVALSVGVCLVPTPTARACELSGFSAGNGETVRPGDPVPYSLYARTTPESPDDSAYKISIGSTVVASGFAEPSRHGGEWSTSGSFQMPDVGQFKGPVTVTARLDSGTGDISPVSLTYDGTPAAPQPADQPAAPPATGAGGTPGATTQTTAPPARSSVPSTTRAPAAKHPRRASRVRQQRSDRARTPAPSKTRTAHPTPQSVAADAPVKRQPAVAALPSQAPAATAPAVRTKHRTRSAPDRTRAADGAPGITRLRSERIAVAVPAARARTQPAPAPDRAPLVVLAAALLLLAGGGAVLWAVRRRRPAPPPEPLTVELELAIEAELQELIAEQRALADDGAPTAPR